MKSMPSAPQEAEFLQRHCVLPIPFPSRSKGAKLPLSTPCGCIQSVMKPQYLPDCFLPEEENLTARTWAVLGGLGTLEEGFWAVAGLSRSTARGGR